MGWPQRPNCPYPGLMKALTTSVLFLPQIVRREVSLPWSAWNGGFEREGPKHHFRTSDVQWTSGIQNRRLREAKILPYGRK